MHSGRAYARRMERARVLLAEDHPRVAEELRRLLEREFDVVAVVGDGIALLHEADDCRIPTWSSPTS